MRCYSTERTRFATGTNASNPTITSRQIGVYLSEDLFNLIKAEALREQVSMGEIIRQCVELVLK